MHEKNAKTAYCDIFIRLLNILNRSKYSLSKIEETSKEFRGVRSLEKKI